MTNPASTMELSEINAEYMQTRNEAGPVDEWESSPNATPKNLRDALCDTVQSNSRNETQFKKADKGLILFEKRLQRIEELLILQNKNFEDQKDAALTDKTKTISKEDSIANLEPLLQNQNVDMKHMMLK